MTRTAAAEAWVDEFLRTCISSRHNSELKHGIATADTYPLPKEPCTEEPIRTKDSEKETTTTETTTETTTQDNSHWLLLLKALLEGRNNTDSGGTTTPTTDDKKKSNLWKYLLSGLGGAAVLAPYLLWFSGYFSTPETPQEQVDPIIIEGRSSLLQELEDRGYHLPERFRQ